jgi:3-hydroxyacyl-[acyl-carrier-protein] dehydratase
MRWYWIDRFVEFQSGKKAKAIKVVSLAEDHLHDQYPHHPIMPHPLIIEGVAQTGGLLVCEHNGFKEKVVLAKISKAIFHADATPGDVLTYSVELEDIRDSGAMIRSEVTLDGKPFAEMNLFFAHLATDHEERTLFEPSTFLKMMRMLGAYDIGVGPDGGPLQEPASLANPS